MKVENDTEFFGRLWSHLEAAEGVVLSSAEKQEVCKAVNAGDSKLLAGIAEYEAALDTAESLSSSGSPSVALVGLFYRKQAANCFAILAAAVPETVANRFGALADPTDVRGRPFATTRPHLFQ